MSEKRRGGSRSHRPSCATIHRLESPDGESILAELLADGSHFLDDIVNVKNHFHHADLLLINSSVKLLLNLRLAHMIHLESQLDSCQRTGESGVTIGNRLSSKTGSLALSSTQKNNNVLGAILLSKLLYSLLVFQIHCTSGGSHEALSRGKHNFSTSALGTGSNSLTGNAIAVADNNNLLISQNAHNYVSFHQFYRKPNTAI